MKFNWLICTILLLTVSVCTAQENSQDVTLASVSYYLNDSEVMKYSEEAMRGSPDAALKLTNFYWMRGRPNKKLAKYWAIIGAENGSQEAQFRAFQGLRTSKSFLDQNRALFWLKKSANQGYPIATAILKSCPDVSQSTPPGATPCFGPGSDR